ncbi:DUF2294 family protein, partial [Paenibacillus sp. 28ISP30-2]|nr:DUF2294 family protein [Paenibacillus sp. 28ISP30-2]
MRRETGFNEIIRKVRKELFGKGPERIHTTFVDNMAITMLYGNLTPSEKFLAQEVAGKEMVHAARTKMVQKIYPVQFNKELEDYMDSRLLHLFSAIKHLFTYTCIVGFLLTTFFALFLFTKITQPMQLLIQAANAIREGRYDTRLSLVTSDEIGELAKTFNHMSTELEATIRSLNEEKNHLSSVLRSMSDAVMTFDRSGQIILTNPPAQSLLDRWKNLEWQEHDQEEFGVSVPGPLLPLFHTVMDRGEDGGDYIHVKQGSWSVQMAPLYTDNVIRGAVAVLRDITEEVKLEKMRSDFVANVSHEIRTPLSMMQGYSEALLDGMAGSPEESEELVRVIHDESLRMGRLVKDLLDLA